MATLAPRVAALLLLAACTSRAPTPVRLAACQILVDGDREANLARIDAALAEAAAQGADLAVLPETCLFGWVNPEAHRRADPIPGASTERLAELARRHGLMLVAGLAEREGERLHDSAVLIDRDGALLLRHRKVNVLSELMDPPYTPGPGAAESVVDTRLGRIGILICADTFRDELVDELAAARPDLVLVPYGWAAPEENWPQHGASLHEWIVHTARRVGAPVLGVVSVGTIGHGPWEGFLLGGQSAFSDAGGNLARPLADREVEVRVFEVPRRARPPGVAQ